MSERRKRDTYRHGTYDRLRVMLYEKRAGWHGEETVRVVRRLVDEIVDVVKDWHREPKP